MQPEVVQNTLVWCPRTLKWRLWVWPCAVSLFSSLFLSSLTLAKVSHPIFLKNHQNYHPLACAFNFSTQETAASDLCELAPSLVLNSELQAIQGYRPRLFLLPQRNNKTQPKRRRMMEGEEGEEGGEEQGVVAIRMYFRHIGNCQTMNVIWKIKESDRRLPGADPWCSHACVYTGTYIHTCTQIYTHNLNFPCNPYDLGLLYQL